MEEKRFLSCPECPYRTLRKSALQRHIGQHIKTKPYACPYCSARHSLEKYHIIHQRQAHPKKQVIINTSSRKTSKAAGHHKPIQITGQRNKNQVTSLPLIPQSVRKPSKSIVTSLPSSKICKSIRPTPSPSPTAKVLSSPKSSASSSPTPNIHQFTVISPSPPPGRSRKRSNSSSSPTPKIQRVRLSPTPSLRLSKNRSSSNSPITLPIPPKVRKRIRRQQSMSPSQESSRSTCSSSCSSQKSPNYSPSPSPPPKVLRSRRSNTIAAQPIRRKSVEK